jgi:hypothetical protein
VLQGCAWFLCFAKVYKLPHEKYCGWHMTWASFKHALARNPWHNATAMECGTQSACSM